MSDLLFIDDCKHEWSECGEHCEHCLNDRDLIEAFTDIQDLLSQANAEIEEKNKLFQTSSDGGANLYKMLLEANAEIERLKGGWISVDTLPEDRNTQSARGDTYKKYWVTDGSHQWEAEMWYWREASPITHWRELLPLPSPPEEQGE